MLRIFTTFDIYFLLVFSVIIGITGLILLINGIRKKKTHIWMTSIFVLLLALILGSASIFFGVRKLLIASDHNQYKRYSFRWYDKTNPGDLDKGFSDETPFSEYTIVSDAFMLSENGNIEDVEVLGRKILLRKGISLGKSDIKLSKDAFRENFVYINVTFEKPYRGNLYLKAFDEDRNGLERSMAEIDIDQDVNIDIEFELDNKTPLSSISYFTLSSIKD